MKLRNVLAMGMVYVLSCTNNLVVKDDIVYSSDFKRGFNYVCWSKDGFSSEKSDSTVKFLAGIGANWLAVVDSRYQASRISTKIYDNGKTSSRASLDHLVSECRKNNFNILLKPHIDIEDDDSRTEIKFFHENDWMDWFKGYKKLITSYAAFAESNHVNIFSIGCELEGTVHRKEWFGVIDAVRKVYSGKITYCALDYEKVGFWDKLDYIGVDLYPEIKIKENDVTAKSITQKLEEMKVFDNLRDFAKKAGKPLLITEWGYKYKDPDKTNSWDWLTEKEPTVEHQKEYYSAFTSCMKRNNFDGFINGTFLWAWHPPADYPQDKYSPMNNPAEKVISNFYKKNKKLGCTR